MSFDHAVLHVLEREGGYVHDAYDRGGETKYGISKRAYPHLNIYDLTIADAKAIYKRDYWDRIRGDEFTGKLEPVAFCLFDAAANQGVTRAVICLQKALGVTADGILGEQTLAAARAASPSALVEQFMAERAIHYASLSGFQHFGRGCMRRVIGVAMEAVK